MRRDSNPCHDLDWLMISFPLFSLVSCHSLGFGICISPYFHTFLDGFSSMVGFCERIGGMKSTTIMTRSRKTYRVRRSDSRVRTVHDVDPWEICLYEHKALTDFVPSELAWGNIAIGVYPCASNNPCSCLCPCLHVTLPFPISQSQPQEPPP